LRADTLETRERFRDLGHRELFEFGHHEHFAALVVKFVEQQVEQLNRLGFLGRIQWTASRRMECVGVNVAASVAPPRRATVITNYAERDPEEPSFDRRSVFELRQTSVNHDEHLLNDVIK
jgi:hypothetical protein